ALVSCQVSLDKVAGRSVTTLEGLSDDARTRYAEVFAATGALQCGFCTPGIVMRAHALIEKKGSELTRESAARLMGGHLCRCTGSPRCSMRSRCSPPAPRSRSSGPAGWARAA
ncbi:MAG: 2Fe-2S iron-sulfur cluster-binding protein, partial [Acidimicrobiales bacterium]